MNPAERIQKVIRAMLAMQRRAWEQGVAAQALLELGETELVILLAKDAVVNQLKDGRLGLNEGKAPVTDPASNGEPVLFAAQITGDETLKRAADRMLEFLLYKAPRTREGIIYHNQIENMIWVDSFYMAPPFLAVAGHPHEAVKQIVCYRKILFHPQKKLYYHIWDEDLQAFTRKLFWGVGNGWAAAGMTRVIRALPSTMQAEKELIAGFVRELLEGCLNCQREDGLFLGGRCFGSSGPACGDGRDQCLARFGLAIRTGETGAVSFGGSGVAPGGGRGLFGRAERGRGRAGLAVG